MMTAATNSARRAAGRQRRGAGDRQADRADVVRRGPQGAARRRPRAASATAARWTRRRRACCRSAWARRRSCRSSCSTPTRSTTFTVCFGVETDTDDAAGRCHRAPRCRGASTEAAMQPRAGAVPRRDRAGAADLLGAQAGGAPALRLRAGRRDGRDRARAACVVHELELTSFAGPAARVVHDALLEGDLRARGGARSRAGAGRRART